MSGARTVQCHANRGREYSVAFDDKGAVQVVRVRCYGPDGKYWRPIWNLTYPRMSTTVSCAIHAAMSKMQSLPAKERT